jgi:hypothetical protein
MAKRSVDCHLVITSLGLLGFNTDEYRTDYPGIAIELPPIAASSFTRGDEPLLLCALHFLLSRADSDEFPHATEPCWPYLNNQARNEFKRIVYRSLRHIQQTRAVDVGELMPPQFWECNLVLSADETWKLLRALTDVCLDIEIDRLRPRTASSTSSSSFASENALRSGQRERSNSITTETDGTIQASGIPFRRKSIVQQQTEIFKSLSKIDSFIVRNGSVEDMNSALSTRTQFLVYIDEEQHKVEELMTLYIAKHNRIRAYMNELDSRYRAAHAAIEKAQKRLSSTAQQEEETYALTEAGRKARVTKLERLHAALSLLTDLAQSPVLADASQRLADSKATLQSPEIAGKDASDPTASDDAARAYLSNGTVANTAADSNTTDATRKLQRNAVDFEVRVEAGKAELLQHASLLYAIEALITRVQHTNAMFHAK